MKLLSVFRWTVFLICLYTWKYVFLRVTEHKFFIFKSEYGTVLDTT